MAYPGRTTEVVYMQDKQKVTLYLPPGLHRQLKIRAAVDSEPMSGIVERAIVFYLAHPEIVDEMTVSYGKNHQVYSCPECSSLAVMQDGELVALANQPGVLVESELTVEKVREVSSGNSQSEELVPC